MIDIGEAGQIEENVLTGVVDNGDLHPRAAIRRLVNATDLDKATARAGLDRVLIQSDEKAIGRGRRCSESTNRRGSDGGRYGALTFSLLQRSNSEDSL